MNPPSPGTADFPLAGEAIDRSTLPATYPYDVYQATGLNDLLACVVFLLEEREQKATFENITVAAHYLFPGKFSLAGYPEFPDASRIQLVILHLGPKYVGWLEGKKKTGYYLNARGREAATSISVRLGVPTTGGGATTNFTQDNLANRTAVETRVARFRRSRTFTGYEEGRDREIDDVTMAWDVFGLFITADSLTKAESYRQLLEAARRQDDKLAVEFLLSLARERPHLIGGSKGSRRAGQGRRNASGRK